ncbi:Acetyl-CoA acetyltransferase [Thermomonospora echinospora]|uniref:Acetyl-CoA acetyltransferase n=1 Tax=Thermomonospora echinospora TaxID=1992 RepID=A0A1H5TXQ3_9ACTN|nr:lipid-transfer protein [Thermomonospora echinospora]SEF67652.1 Acetyl-CoA acetyltransferase [Thermomonospora echinospora]
MSEALSHRDRCAIAGIGATEFSKDSGRSELTLAAQACRAALQDAGLTVADVDGVVSCDYDLVSYGAIADALGIADLTYWGQTGPGGSGPCAMVGQAVAAILSGQATTVLVYRALNGRSGRRYGLGAPDPDARVGGRGAYEEFFAPYGLVTPGQFFALLAQRHMSTYGTRYEALAEIALACREAANRNPAAQMHERALTLEQCLAARPISLPLRLFDFCLETDGACAVVVTSAERAADCAQPPVLVRAVAQSTGPRVQPGVMYPMLMRPDITVTPSQTVARTLFSRAGLGPSEVDVAQIYDCFTITVLLQLEDYGFCAKGEGGAFTESGALRPGGALPINTAGGNLSEGYVHGMNHVLEGVRQIRGTSTSQVTGAEVSLVTSAPPPGTSALLLVRG